ncbi:hypothetical protein THOM_2430 [Trachipleistophora hominis]|uniref:Uncharacterized protein n=1 Tax=Trachipleistophora hominis TaxID=72359 RepID=L7JUD1_TRAHO|nr:hypothetical protein THOM_2430 [Trachipleistophora hominis]
MGENEEKENTDYIYFCSIVDDVCEFISEEDVLDTDLINQ